MKLTGSKIEVKKLTLSLREHTCVGYEEEVASKVRQLPGVVHVRIVFERREIEIWFSFPAEGLLRQINEAMKTYGCEVVAGQVR